jgi:nucleotide-binding universal stress UspA family protein
VRILVAIDGSNDAKAAVAWLQRLPLRADRSVGVLTAVQPPIPFVDVDSAHEIRDALLTEVRGLVDDTAAELRLGGDMTTGEVVLENDPREAIVAEAREWRPDVIVMGARGLGGVSAGSCSAVCRCPCPGRRRADSMRLLGVVEPHHYPSRAAGFRVLPRSAAAIEADRRAALEAELAAAAKRVGVRQLAVEMAVVSGPPADLIVGDIERSGTAADRHLTLFARLSCGEVVVPLSDWLSANA